jgi:hypothetical protein
MLKTSLAPILDRALRDASHVTVVLASQRRHRKAQQAPQQSATAPAHKQPYGNGRENLRQAELAL